MSVQIPTVYDQSLAPDGTNSATPPVSTRSTHWRSMRRTSARAPDIRTCIRDWKLLTLSDIEQRVGLTHGNIRHVEMVLGQMLADRPLSGWSDYRTPIRDLYLCGAGTHPGGEVTGAPGHDAAQAVLRDLRAPPAA